MTKLNVFHDTGERKFEAVVQTEDYKLWTLFGVIAEQERELIALQEYDWAEKRDVVAEA